MRRRADSFSARLGVRGDPNAKDLTWLICLSWNSAASVTKGVKPFSELWPLQTLPIFLD